jgi:hypothetical protein
VSYDLEFTRTLATHVQDVLDIVVQTFGQAGVTLPERQYITSGGTAHDCEQVTVSFQQMYLGPPGDQAAEPQRCDGPRSASVLVEVVRCIPSVNSRTGVPDPQAQANFAVQQLVDAWMLLEAGTLMTVYGILGDVTAGEPQGSYQAMSLTLTMMVGAQ